MLDLRLEDEKREALRERLATVRERIWQWLLRWVEGGFLSPQERAEAGDVLARLGDPRFHGAERLCLPRCHRGEEERRLGFVKVRGGRFQMGSNMEDDPEAEEVEMVAGKAHVVNCVDYDYLAVYPVTVGQYGVFVEKGGYKAKRWWRKQGLDWLQGS